MKKTFIGWVGKDELDDLKKVESLYELDLLFFDTKGHKIDWLKVSWPPIKIKVTVETVEKDIWGTEEINL